MSKTKTAKTKPTRPTKRPKKITADEIMQYNPCWNEWMVRQGLGSGKTPRQIATATRVHKEDRAWALVMALAGRDLGALASWVLDEAAAVVGRSDSDIALALLSESAQLIDAGGHPGLDPSPLDYENDGEFVSALSAAAGVYYFATFLKRELREVGNVAFGFAADVLYTSVNSERFLLRLADRF